MTKAQIYQIKKTSSLYFNLPVKHKKELQKIQKDLTNLQKLCDHKYPNGESAVSNGMFCAVCEICHSTDY